MPRETITIPVSTLQPYEAAAQLLAVIAYPDSQNERRRFADAICGWVLKQSWDDPELASTPVTAPPRYWQAAADGDAVMNNGMLAINRKVLIAAKMASPVVADFLQQTSPGFQAVRPTSEKMITAVSKDLKQRKRLETRGSRKGGEDTVATKDNVSRRNWKPSRPVLHLCVAMHRVIHELSPNQQDINLGDLMNPITITGIIGIARAIAPALQPLFNIKPEELIEVIAA
jgi:hypothetical protein